MPSSRNSSGVDCDRRSSSARWSSQQSLGLCPSASAISARRVRRRASSSIDGSVQCAPSALRAHGLRHNSSGRCARTGWTRPKIHDATAEERSLLELQEDVSRGMEAMPLLRIQRVRRETRGAGPPLHATEAARVGAANRQAAGRTAAARRARRGSEPETAARTRSRSAPPAGWETTAEDSAAAPGSAATAAPTGASAAAIGGGSAYW